MSRFAKLNKFQSAILLSSFALVMFIVIFAIAEAGIRVRHYLKYGGFHAIEKTYKMDEKANLRIPVQNKKTGPISINSLGFRGPEIVKDKKNHTFRLAFLGASTTYCAEVSSNDMVWADLLTKMLASHWPEKQFDFINGGVPGYMVKSSIRNLKNRVSQFRPDAIIIYHSTNDLSFNTRILAKAQKLVPEKKSINEDLSWFSQYSLLAYLVEKNLKILSLQKQAKEIGGTLQYETAEITAPFERDLHKLVDESKKAARFVALVTFSHRIREEQSPEEKARASMTSLYYMPYMSVDGILEAFNAYNNVIRRVAREKNVYLIDGNNTIPGDEVHFNDSVHFTDQGSRRMAARIFAALIKAQHFRELLE